MMKKRDFATKLFCELVILEYDLNYHSISTNGIYKKVINPYKVNPNI